MWQPLMTTVSATASTDYPAAAAAARANGSGGADYGGAERRSKPRIEGSFPAVVHGVDANDETFQIETTIDNLSAGGLYLRLRQQLEPGTALFFVTSLTMPGRVTASAPRLALHGVVLRAELTHGGKCGVAVALSNYHFLGAE
jgi:PilZ domain